MKRTVLLQLYALLIKLYPNAYKHRYGKEMLEIAEDMLHDARTPISQTVVWSHVIFDTSITASRQQLSYIGDIVQSSNTPRYIKTNSTIAALLLVPFLVAISVNSLDYLLFKQSLVTSWLWQAPVLGIWVGILPGLALLITSISYGIFLFRKQPNQDQGKRGTSYFWPLLITGIAALGIVLLLFFHDSVGCFMRNPTLLITHTSQVLQCAEQGSLNLHIFLQNVF